MPTSMAELGSDNFDQELTLSLLGTERNALDEIEAAIVRIEDGTYGRVKRAARRFPSCASVPSRMLCSASSVLRSKRAP